MKLLGIDILMIYVLLPFTLFDEAKLRWSLGKMLVLIVIAVFACSLKKIVECCQ